MTPEYGTHAQEMWQDMVTPNVDLPDVTASVNMIKKNWARYLNVAQELHLPDKCAAVIGVIHMRESSFDFTKHLANGDPLTGDTTHVPKNIMFPLMPPYTWEEGALAALKGMSGVQNWNIDLENYNWDVPHTLWFINAYNGFGYPKTINTPYLWAYTQFYERGYFGSDGNFNPNLINDQPGAAPVLKSLGFTGG